MQLQLYYAKYTTPQVTTPLHYSYNYSCTTPRYIQQLWARGPTRWPLPTVPIKHTSNHLSVHQRVRSAIRDSQQSTAIQSGISSGIQSGILSGISSGILSGISSGILSDILSGISFVILSGRWGPPIHTELGRSQVEVQRCTLSLGLVQVQHTELGRSLVEAQQCTLEKLEEEEEAEDEEEEEEEEEEKDEEDS